VSSCFSEKAKLLFLTGSVQTPAIIRSGDLRAENRARILRALRHQGGLPRAALGEATGLSQAAISALTVQLADAGILDITTRPNVRSRTGTPSRGRPQTLVALAPAASHVLTAALTIDQLRTAIVDYAGNELAAREHKLDTRALETEALLAVVIDSIESMIRQSPNGRVGHIGLGFQGVTGNERGELLWSPIIAARRVPLGETLTRHFGVPAEVNNDCALIASALHQSHAHRLGPNFAAVIFSHGVGLGLRLEGRAFTGVRSSALEIGHLRFAQHGALCRCGRRGCIEAYASDYGIERLARDASLDEKPPGRVNTAMLSQRLQQALDGEAQARLAFATAGAAVGEGLAALFALFDSMPVAIVGRSDAAFSLMAETLRGALDAAGRDATGDACDLHCFADEEPLLHAGLAFETLDSHDRTIAMTPTETPSGDRQLSA